MCNFNKFMGVQGKEFKGGGGGGGITRFPSNEYLPLKLILNQ